MATTGIIPTLLLFFGFLVLINAQCPKQNLQLRLRECSQIAYKVINTTQCTNLATPLLSIYDCFHGCTKDEIPQDLANQLTVIQKEAAEAVQSRCQPSKGGGTGPAEAIDGEAPAAACGIQEGLVCVAGITDLTNIPQNIGLANLKGACNIVKGLSGFIKNCGGLIVDCLDVFANLNFPVNDIRNGINIANELSQGGCDCADQIEIAVRAYTELPTTGDRACPIIQATTRTVRGVLDQCVNSITKAVGVTSLDWINIALTAIDIANPVVGGICGTFTILSGNGASTIGLSFLAAASMALVHLLRR